MAFCPHTTDLKRPLQIEGFDAVQYVCSECWERAIEAGLVDSE